MVTHHVAEDKIIKIKRNPWVDNFFRPLLITVMIMCINLSLVNLVRLINPAWRGTYFLMGMLITMVEAIYSYRVLNQAGSRGISLLRYRLAEATVLILILKLLSFFDKPWPSIVIHLQSIWQAPTTFFNLEFYILLILAMLSWLAATNTIADIEDLYDPYSDNRMPLDSLASRFFWGGGILLVVSGITQWVTRSGLSSLTDWQRPSISGVILNVLLYFVLGLVLLSQVNLTRLQVRWRIQKITVTSGLVKQWARYGLIFLGLIALVAFLLPTQYTLGFLTTAGFVIGFILGIIVFIFQLLLFLITLPFYWLFSLLGTTPLEPGSAANPIPPPEYNPSSDPFPPWLEILRSVIFWLVTLAIVGYLFKGYLDDHPGLIKQLRHFKPLDFLLNLLTQIWRQLTSWTQAARKMLPERVTKKAASKNDAAATQKWNWWGLRKLSPREQILQYYLNILERAERKGLPRREHQTPYEYEPNLTQSVPDVQLEIQEVTDTFVHARYSKVELGQEQAKLVKAKWRQIRKALKHGKKSEESKKDEENEK